MSTTTTNYGLIKPDTTDPILIGQLNDNADIIDATLKSLSDVLDVAKLGIKYKGEVNYYSNLPASGNEIGDAYTVKYAGSSGTTPDGTEYVWGTVSGTNQWINFSKDSYTKAEVDALLTLKQNALNSAQLAAVNSGIDSAKVEQIETNKNNISKDEAALIELVDGGAKNKLNFDGVSSAQTAGVAFTVNADGSVTATRVEASSSPANVALSISGNRFDVTSFCNGNYMLSGCPNGGGSTSYEIMATIAGGAYIKRDYGEGVLLTDAGTTTDIYIQLTVRSTFTGTITFRPMLCTKAAWNISHAYVPYRPSYQELYEMVKALQANQ